MSFSSDLKKFTDKVEKNGEKIFRGTFIAVTASVMKRSPVKTGRFRGNWQTDVNKPSAGELDRLDKTGTASLREAVTESASAKLGDSLYFVNNLPYAKSLEDGSSTQAPTGMVEVTVNQFQREVNRQAKNLK